MLRALVPCCQPPFTPNIKSNVATIKTNIAPLHSNHLRYMRKDAKDEGKHRPNTVVPEEQAGNRKQLKDQINLVSHHIYRGALPGGRPQGSGLLPR